MADRVVDIEAEVRVQTDRAVLLWDGKTEDWVPKSQVEVNGDGTVTMPEWLAVEKGFV
jgi:hypothetical protein